MPRRIELKGICNDLLDSFISRYNDLDGYWALGKIQSFLQSTSENSLRLNLVGEPVSTTCFPQTLSYYRLAFDRQLELRKIPNTWVIDATLEVKQLSSSELNCSLKVTTDHGRVFKSCRLTIARPHNPELERQRHCDYGPSNQKGV